MPVQLFALGLLAVVFLVASIVQVHMGALALVAAFGVGILLAGEDADQVLEGFPVSILLLLLGVNYLFAIARDCGVVDWIIDRVLALVRGRVALLPWVFFALATGLGAMGSPLTALALAPVAMVFVDRHRLDPMVLGLAVIMGGSAGGFAPTSLFGLITNGVAVQAGIDPNPGLLFAAGLSANLLLFAVAVPLFRRSRSPESESVSAPGGGVSPAHPPRRRGSPVRLVHVGDDGQVADDPDRGRRRAHRVTAEARCLPDRVPG